MKGEILFNLLLVALLTVLYLVSRGFGGRTVSTDHFGPQGFPQLLILLSLGVLGVLTVRAILALRKEKPSPAPTFGFLKQPMLRSSLILIGYVFCLDLFGYIVSTVCFIFIGARAIGYASNLKLALFTCMVTGILVLVFGSFFFVPLPRGMGLLRELSYMIY
jgi:hypothetical protein